MSHGHTHGPGTPANHTHGPPSPLTPQQAQQLMMQQQAAQAQMGQQRPAPDPVLQAAIEADFKPVALALGDAEKPSSIALCREHKKETCTDCGLDFTAMNAMAKMFAMAPPDAILPPPNVVQQARAQAVSKTKDEGNALYKKNQHVAAINMYTTAMQISSSRPPWEASNIAREELTLVVCNRSAAFYAAGDYLSSLIDSEVVISLKRPWSKGHYRKGRALLALGDPEAAMEAVTLGLQYEPQNQDLEAFQKEVREVLQNKATQSPDDEKSDAA
ncbi:hypothetical protein FRC17_008385 [Serendipita sp. 399]|nr:hypothetical protein FRC17_008385 [Serendipita sp. 399]